MLFLQPCYCAKWCSDQARRLWPSFCVKSLKPESVVVRSQDLDFNIPTSLHQGRMTDWIDTDARTIVPGICGVILID